MGLARKSSRTPEELLKIELPRYVFRTETFKASKLT